MLLFPTRYTAFSGAGNSMAGEDEHLAATAALGVASSLITPAPFSVDESKPKTRVRVTLPSGKREVFTFNTDHTVADLLSQVGSYV